MPPISKFEFGLINAYALRQQHGGGEYAVFMNRPGGPDHAPVIKIVARHSGALAPWSSHTAIVNGIQASAGVNLGNLLVFTTYPPTVACLGAMKTHNLHSVTYLDVTGTKRYINMAASANVNALAPAPLPAAAGADRIGVPGPFVIPAGISANPATAVPPNALTYLTNMHANANVAQLLQWKTSWNGVGRIAGARGIAGLNAIHGGGPIAGQQYADVIYTLLIYTIAGRISPPAHNGARIAALLGSRSGQIYGWQVNQRGLNTTYHAETNLLQALGGAVPADATLYSTLDPCHQCAGLFVKAGGQRCVFGQNDPNMTGNTALNGMNQRFQERTFFTGTRVGILAGDQLDFIRDRSTVGYRAASAGAALQNGLVAAPGMTRVQTAVAQANLAAIQRRVLDILDAPPSMEVYRQSERLLRKFIQVGAVVFPDGPPAVLNSAALVLQLFP